MGKSNDTATVATATAYSADTPDDVTVAFVHGPVRVERGDIGQTNAKVRAVADGARYGIIIRCTAKAYRAFMAARARGDRAECDRFLSDDSANGGKVRGSVTLPTLELAQLVAAATVDAPVVTRSPEAARAVAVAKVSSGRKAVAAELY